MITTKGTTIEYRISAVSFIVIRSKCTVYGFKKCFFICHLSLFANTDLGINIPTFIQISKRVFGHSAKQKYLTFSLQLKAVHVPPTRCSDLCSVVWDRAGHAQRSHSAGVTVDERLWSPPQVESPWPPSYIYTTTNEIPSPENSNHFFL